jgi:uncharacterized protein (DUF433 family)
VLRIGRSRVSLDVVVEHYESGMTPEDLIREYDSLELADVHGAIEYYLRHRQAVQEYLTNRREDAAALRQEIETRHPRVTRQELMARRSAPE